MYNLILETKSLLTGCFVVTSLHPSTLLSLRELLLFLLESVYTQLQVKWFTSTPLTLWNMHSHTFGVRIRIDNCAEDQMVSSKFIAIQLRDAVYHQNESSRNDTRVHRSVWKRWWGFTVYGCDTNLNITERRVLLRMLTITVNSVLCVFSITWYQVILTVCISRCIPIAVITHQFHFQCWHILTM